MAPGAAFIAAQVPTTLPPLGRINSAHVRWAAGGHVSPTGANLRSQKMLFAQKNRGIGKLQNNNNTSSLSLRASADTKCSQSSCAMLGHCFVRQISFEHSFKQIDKNQESKEIKRANKCGDVYLHKVIW